MKKPTLTIVFALLFTVAVLVLGYVMLGLLPTFLFAFGFLGGFILWLIIPTNNSFDAIAVPFYVTLGFL